MPRTYREGQKVIVNSEVLCYENEPATVIYASHYMRQTQVEMENGDQWYLDPYELKPAPREPKQQQ